VLRRSLRRPEGFGAQKVASAAGRLRCSEGRFGGRKASVLRRLLRQPEGLGAQKVASAAGRLRWSEGRFGGWKASAGRKVASAAGRSADRKVASAAGRRPDGGLLRQREARFGWPILYGGRRFGARDRAEGSAGRCEQRQEGNGAGDGVRLRERSKALKGETP
jgi:hypothetical protein